MTSIRHTTPSRAEESILDAALATVLAVGIGRTTLTEVARRAGVSRMTGYRHFADVNSLIRSLLTREFGRLLASILDSTNPAGAASERLVSLLVAAVRELPGHPLMRKMLELDVDLLGPYVVDHLGSTQRAAEAAILALVTQAQAEDSTRIVDPAATALMLLLATQSLILSRKILIDSGLDDEVLQSFETFVRAGLGIPQPVPTP